MKYLLLVSVLLLPACTKQVTTCFQLGENAHAHAEFGYFYDSAVIDVNGPTTFQRLAKDSTANMCGVSP